MWRAIFIVFFCMQIASAADEDWRLERDRDAIQVYTRAVDGSKHRAVRSTMTVNAELGELVALIKDTAACPEWAAFCKRSEVLETISDTEFVVYTYNDIPWPAADRDAVTTVTWSQSESGVVTMAATIVEHAHPSIRRVVRLIDGETSWKFTPQVDGQIFVETQAHINPRGKTPAWLTNRLLVDAPFDTLVGMRELLKSERYQGSNVEFLTVNEP